LCAAAPEEPHSEFVFRCGDGSRQGGLGHVKLLGGNAEIEDFTHSGNVP
jgi:hypothetical protein